MIFRLKEIRREHRPLFFLLQENTWFGANISSDPLYTTSLQILPLLPNDFLETCPQVPTVVIAIFSLLHDTAASTL